MRATLAREFEEGFPEEVTFEPRRRQIMQGLGGYSKESELLFYSSATGSYWRV